MCLVVLDAIFVMGEVLIDLAIIKLEHENILPEVRMHSFVNREMCSFVNREMCSFVNR